MARIRKTGKTTLSDVALAANVSAITVSRALHAPDKVSEKLRLRIERAVNELGYVPDPAARALASQRTNVIGALIPSVTNFVFADVLRAIFDRVEDSPYAIQLGNTRYSPLQEEKLLRVFLSQRPAGLIVAGVDQSQTSRALLADASCPVVQIMDMDEQPIDMVVGLSHQAAAGAATQHLLECGYRKLAFVGARMDPRTQRRFQGFRTVAEAAGVFSERRVITTVQQSSATMGTSLFAELLSVAPDTDAVFCNNDDLALGVLFEAQRRKIKVPEQLGICGFNDFEMSAATEPPLTSVRTFRRDMGARAIEMLIDAMEGRPPAEKIVNLGFKVLARGSTRAPVLSRKAG